MFYGQQFTEYEELERLKDRLAKLNKKTSNHNWLKQLSVYYVGENLVQVADNFKDTRFRDKPLTVENLNQANLPETKELSRVLKKKKDSLDEQSDAARVKISVLSECSDWVCAYLVDFEEQAEPYLTKIDEHIQSLDEKLSKDGTEFGENFRKIKISLETEEYNLDKLNEWGIYLAGLWNKVTDKQLERLGFQFIYEVPFLGGVSLAKQNLNQFTVAKLRELYRVFSGKEASLKEGALEPNERQYAKKISSVLDNIYR